MFFFLKSVAPLKSLDYTNSYNEFDKILQNKVQCKAINEYAKLEINNNKTLFRQGENQNYTKSFSSRPS